MKFRLQPMLGFQRFYNARRVIAGIELMQKIHKGQFAAPAAFVRIQRRSGVEYSPLNDHVEGRIGAVLSCIPICTATRSVDIQNVRKGRIDGTPPYANSCQFL